MKYFNDILEIIGNTPLVKLNTVGGPDHALVLAKLEYLNPGGSIKDRMALHIIEKAEKAGILKPGGTIVENTSGNTGIGVALVAAKKGYKSVFTMPDKMSQEKIDTLKGLGARVVITPTNVPADSPESYYEVAKKIARETPNSFYLNQYHSKDNIEAHYLSTGAEIWEQTGGQIDYFVAGIGTGGTMSGAGKFLKEKNPDIKNIAVDPVGSVFHGYFKTGKLPEPKIYKVEGIGEDMLCGALDFSVIDDIRQVDDRESFLMARQLARKEGLFVGGSSGSAARVAADLAKEAGKGKVIVVVLVDSGNRYITKFYSDEWMKDNRFIEEDEEIGLIRDVLKIKSSEVEFAKDKEIVKDVVERMKIRGISQMPVLDNKNNVKGMIHELDLLNFLIKEKGKIDITIEELVAPLQGVVKPDAPTGHLKEIFDENNVAIVMEEEKVLGILTKIDLIEYLGKKFT